MYYNIKPVNDENICIQCFEGVIFRKLFRRLLKYYDKGLYTYLVVKLDTALEITPISEYVFKKALPKSFRKLWKAEKEGECVLNAKDCRRLIKVLANYGWLNDFDAECLYGTLEWALYNNVDICVKASDTPFK